jgi:hypothetical protein
MDHRSTRIGADAWSHSYVVSSDDGEGFEEVGEKVSDLFAEVAYFSQDGEPALIELKVARKGLDLFWSTEERLSVLIQRSCVGGPAEFGLLKR